MSTPRATDAAVDAALRALAARLLAERTPGAGWTGELSSSALATAVTIAALQVVDGDAHRSAITRGAVWLRRQINEDGGWGDSPASPSDLSTTVLAWSALRLVEGRGPHLDRCEGWIRERIGSLDPANLACALAARYGRDRTFSAPILTVAALAGVLGETPECWRMVPQLPFELAVLPHRLLSFLRVQVVSYALPALIAIGLLRHERRASAWWPVRAFRNRVRERVLRKLERIQPASGGFLEAAPLTAFVALSLGACGMRHSTVVDRCVAFLRAGQRADGSWPIDANLATWVTTLAVKALAASGTPLGEARDELRHWLLQQQHERVHALTQAAPGGFAWTDLPGGVPDADDTAGSLLALHVIDPIDEGSVHAAARRACAWLMGLQNGDGGVPTFCRGWGRLAFDRSTPDVTAHAIAALATWLPRMRASDAPRGRRFVRRALRYLARVQQPDGSWLPLWFGNPWQAGGANPVYGTAQVLAALGPESEWDDGTQARLDRAAEWLLRAQNGDGGWGRDAQGRSTIEETGLALAALAGRASGRPLEEPTDEALGRAAHWLCARIAADALEPVPIGLYFASLRYAERLYPIVFALTGLARLRTARSRSERAPRGAAKGRAA